MKRASSTFGIRPTITALSLLATLCDTTNVSAVPPPPGLVAWWQGEGNGLDSVGTNHAVSGATMFSPGEVGQGFSFDGGTNKIVVPDSPSLNFGVGQDLTIEAWIQSQPAPGNNPPNEQHIIQKKYAPDAFHYIGYKLFLANGQLYFLMGDQPLSVGGLIVNGGPNLQDGKFHHVAVTVDRDSTTGGHLYVDGTNVLTFNPTSQSGSLANNEPILIGEQDTPGYRTPFKGVIDELSLYGRALTPAEIVSIFAARGAGKTPSSPTIMSVTPPSWFVNEGSSVSYTVTATGSPTLAYQWQFRSMDIADATNATLVLTNVIYAQAGSYHVVVTNSGGTATSASVLLQVNRAPIADASATETLVISPNGTNAAVVLNGSRSSDPDGDALRYTWFLAGDTDVLAATVVAIRTLPVGTNQLLLRIWDGMAFGSQMVTVEVITTAQAVDRLAALVRSESPNAQPLLATFRAALAAIGRNQPGVAINQLEAFKNKVLAQVMPVDSALATQLLAEAQAIIDAINDGTLPTSTSATTEITSITRAQNDKAHLKIKGAAGRVHIVETSTNMVDWTPVGVANPASDGSFEFEDAAPADATRFYRVVSPR